MARRSQGLLGSGPSWTLEVNNFGKIRQASLEMTPLVILVGKNNTGKSYLASLAWAVLNFRDVFMNQDLDSLGSTGCPPFLSELHEKAMKGDHESTRLVTGQEFSEWATNLMNQVKEEALSELMAWPGLSCGKLGLTVPGEFEYILHRKPFEEEDEEPRWVSAYSIGSSPDGVPVFEFRYDDHEGDRWLRRSVAPSFVHYFLNHERATRGRERATYVPAARTGLLLALRPLVSYLLGDLGIRQSRSQPGFTLPTVRFLQTLIDEPSERKSITSDIADFIEEEILGGKVRQRDGSKREIEYTPSGVKGSIPLHATSSMVTELAAILILLRSADLSGGLVLEEPEAHLHISAQRTMARAVARLVNRGIPVVLTTHSDTFLQQINLLITLGNLKNGSEIAEKYDYSDEDIIAPDMASAYQFTTYRGKTNVSRVEKNEFGFVVPSLNDVLEDLTKQVLDIQDLA